MTDKRQIKVAELEDRIYKLFKQAKQKFDSYEAWPLDEGKRILVALDECDHLYEHIHIVMAIGVEYRESGETKKLLSKSLRIEALEIIDGGSLPLKYSVPNIKKLSFSSISYELQINRCCFKSFSIAISSVEELKNANETKFYGEITKINFALTFDSSSFHKLALRLPGYEFKSKGIKYEYKYSAKLVNENNIQELVIHDEYPDVIAWGIQEKIGEGIIKEYKNNTGRDGDEYGRSPIKRAWETIENNKSVLMEFKNLAIKKNDRFQESTINYHIARCDEQFMNLETEPHFFQNKAIMWFGRILSRHGTSWMRPLLCIGAFNLLSGIIIFAVLNFCVCPCDLNRLDILYIFGALNNPLSTPINIVQGIHENFKYETLGGFYIGIAFIVLLSKGFYAMCIYEFVRVARRFTLK